MDLYQKNPQFELAEKICQTLQQKGFIAYLAGGCVRDFLLKRTPNDFDVATNATPDEVESLFPKTVPVGKSFGVMIVVEGSEEVEVATFRKDGPYKDGRRPESIEFSAAEEDAQRRDFTINGLFYDLQKSKVIDYVQGMKDLSQKQIRAIGQPQKRFEEDHLRLLRGVRFAAQLGFEIEAETWQAILDSKGLIRTVSGERIQDEISKLLKSSFVVKGLQLFFESGLLQELVGFQALKWQDPQLLFSRNEGTLEDQWFRFFFWLQLMSPQKPKKSDFEKLCDDWKFSRDLKQKTLKALGWTLNQSVFLNHPVGEILALSFESEHQRGIQEYVHFFLSPEEKPNFEKFTQRKKELGEQKPSPWVQASDLSSSFKGEELGKALKASYWEQLEGRVQSKSDLLKKWGL